MARDTGSARAAAAGALRGFRFHEYAPFAWILLGQLAALALAMNLGTAWGMGTMGWLARRIAGDGPVHYPVFFVFLPNLMSFVEAFLYTLPGSFLIPLALIRILRRTAPESGAPEGEGRRALRAVPPVLVGGLATLALITGWQWLLGKAGVGEAISGLLGGGLSGASLVWLVGVLVAYFLSAVFLYIPVAAVLPGRGFGGAIGEGLRAGVARWVPTFLIVVLFSLPALAILWVTQVLGGRLVSQVRPEVTAALVAVYSILISLATYFIYKAVARYYEGHIEEAE